MNNNKLDEAALLAGGKGVFSKHSYITFGTKERPEEYVKKNQQRSVEKGKQVGRGSRGSRGQQRLRACHACMPCHAERHTQVPSQLPRAWRHAAIKMPPMGLREGGEAALGLQAGPPKSKCSSWPLHPCAPWLRQASMAGPSPPL